jgi:hypothetical protein
MLLAVRFTVLGEETLTFEVHLTRRAVETFRVPVLVECLDPTIARFNRELTSVTLSLEHRSPVFRTVDLAILIMETSSAYRLVALTAQEATHMKGVLHGVHHFANYSTTTLSATGCKILFVIFFAVQLSLLFHESNVDQWLTAVWIGTDEMVWAPSLVQC